MDLFEYYYILYMYMYMYMYIQDNYLTVHLLCRFLIVHLKE